MGGPGEKMQGKCRRATTKGRKGMLIKITTRKPEAQSLWLRRVDALRAGSILLERKPDRALWSRHELRVWRYATAISRRMGRLN